MAEKKTRTKFASGQVNLVGLGGHESPELKVHLLDAKGEVLAAADVTGDGSFEVQEALLKRSVTALIGPTAADPAEERQLFRAYPAQTFQDRILAKTIFDIGRSRWGRWFRTTTCVSGSVRHCFPKPWIVGPILEEMVELRPLGRIPTLPGVPTLIPRLRRPRCHPVCVGIVEVYRRRCCCRPITIFDPRITDIIERGPIPVPLPIPDPIPDPPLPFPEPEPGPDPVPWEELDRIMTGGALDARKINAGRDVAALKTLSPTEQVEFLQARPYLWCACSEPVKVAEGTIQDDATFDICWREPATVLPRGCRFEVAYKVKQPRNGSLATIYDGVASGQWFAADDDATLTSYSRLAVGCKDSPVPGSGRSSFSKTSATPSRTSSERQIRTVSSRLVRLHTTVGSSTPCHSQRIPTLPRERTSTAISEGSSGSATSSRTRCAASARPTTG